MKVGQVVTNSGLNKTIEKTFIRNFQWVTAKSAFHDGKLYYREWKIEQEHGNPIAKYMRSYNNGMPIPNSTAKIDYRA